MNFVIGDRVMCVVEKPFVMAGMLGTVASTDDGHYVGVAWDERMGGHNLGGLCADGHGWWINETYLVRIDGDEAEETDSISVATEDELRHFLLGAEG